MARCPVCARGARKGTSGQVAPGAASEIIRDTAPGGRPREGRSARSDQLLLPGPMSGVIDMFFDHPAAGLRKCPSRPGGLPKFVFLILAHGVVQGILVFPGLLLQQRRIHGRLFPDEKKTAPDRIERESQDQKKACSERLHSTSVI